VLLSLSRFTIILNQSVLAQLETTSDENYAFCRMAAQNQSAMSEETVALYGGPMHTDA
jgi:hypothetical protein